MRHRLGVGTAIGVFTIIVVIVVGSIGLDTYMQSAATQPCPLAPGLSVVTEDGVPKCVTGPPLVISSDGKADFRNGTVIDLHVNATGAAVLGNGGSGGENDAVILTNGTRIIFNSRGVMETIEPYQGKEVFSNGTIIAIPVCPYAINADLRLAYGLSGNGTAWYTSSDGAIVSFYPNGTCSEATSGQTTTSSASTSTCSGYPPGGNCLATYSYTFTLSVNYSGSWKLVYQGYNSLGARSNPINVSGSYTGTGFYSRNVTLSGLNNDGLTLCAAVQKLDASTGTLILTVTGHNETSLPYGSTSYCGGVVP